MLNKGIQFYSSYSAFSFLKKVQTILNGRDAQLSLVKFWYYRGWQFLQAAPEGVKELSMS